MKHLQPQGSIRLPPGCAHGARPGCLTLQVGRLLLFGNVSSYTRFEWPLQFFFTGWKTL